MGCGPLATSPAFGAPFQNVTSETVDVTGLCKDFDDWLEGKRHAPPPPVSPVHLPTGKPDLVVSLNLLSQLPLQLIARANARNKLVEPVDFADSVMRSHIDWLKSLACPVLLLTDLQRQYRKGDTIKVENALPEMDLGIQLDDWLWEVAPPGESGKYDTVHHKVGAFMLNRHGMN